MISFEHNIRDFERALSDLARRQLPFATAMALNDTAKDVSEAWGKHLQRRLDRPTPFTVRSRYVRRASKRKLTATVGIKDRQASYLKYQVEGGTRLPARRALLVPVRARLNRYGNMPRGAVARALARPNTFSGKVGRAAGVFQRQARRSAGLKMLVAYASRASYGKRLDLQQVAEKRARASFARHFARRFRAAMATAR